MEEFGVFMVNEDVHETLLEKELEDVLLTVESMLTVSRQELLDATISQHQHRFISALIEQMGLTKLLFNKAYGVSPGDEPRQNIFYLNPALSEEMVRVELTSHIYQVNSMCYLGAFHILVDKLSEHLVNTLTVINNCTNKMVRLIDTLNMQRPVL